MRWGLELRLCYAATHPRHLATLDTYAEYVLNMR